MGDTRILLDLLIVLSIGVGVVVLFHAIRLPPVAGFLTAGVLQLILNNVVLSDLFVKTSFFVLFHYYY